MKTVAEGAEHKEDWDLLKDLNCDVIQGFIVSKPMPHAGVPQWAKTWRG